MTENIFVFLYIILAISFIIFIFQNNENWIYGTKTLWYLLAVVYGALHFLTDLTNVENIYTVVLFIIVFIELFDNARLMGKNKV